MQSKQLLQQLKTAIEAKDLDTVENLFTQDIQFQNMAEAKISGRDAAVQAIKVFFDNIESTKWNILSTTIEENRIVFERLNEIKMQNSLVQLPTATILEISNGQISHFRDYFDRQTFSEQLSGGNHA